MRPLTTSTGDYFSGSQIRNSRGHHFGWQRPLGHLKGAATFGGASCRRGSGASVITAAPSLGIHTLTLFALVFRQLAKAGGGGRRDSAAAA